MDCDKHRCKQKLIFNFRTVLLWFPLMCLSFLKIYPCASVFICGSKAFKRRPPMDCDEHRCEQKLIFNFRTVLLWFPLMCLSFLKIYPCASVFICGSKAFKRKPPMDCDEHRCKQKFIFIFDTVLTMVFHVFVVFSFIRVHRCSSVVQKLLFFYAWLTKTSAI